jgi:UV DNA damage repair endonuclease
MNFEIGYTALFEGIIGMIILGVGYNIYLAIALPVTVITTAINFIYAKVLRELSKLKEKHVHIVRNYVNYCTGHSFPLFRLRKF